MFALALSVVSSSLLMVIFKYFERYKVNTLQAITVNYITAAVLGSFIGGSGPNPNAQWFPVALGMGIMFITIFNVIALSAQKVGVAVSSVANKMSLVIPVAAGALLLGEPLGLLRGAGIALGLVAVVLVTFSGAAKAIDRKYAFLPLILFVGSGVLDAVLNHVREQQLTEAETPVFSATVFSVAATLGILSVLFKRIKQSVELTWQSVVGGVVLGVPNYFSIHYLIKALHAAPGTVVFPVNNTGIVLLSTVLAMLLFQERPNMRAWLGIGLAVLSIVILTR